MGLILYKGQTKINNGSCIINTVGQYIEVTPTSTPVNSQTPTPSITSSPTQTPTPSITASPTQTPTPSITSSPTQTPTPSITASPTQTPTPSITASPTQTPTPSITASPTQTQTQTPTPSITASPTQTPTPSITASPTPPLSTQTPTPSITASPTQTQTQTPTPSSTTVLKPITFDNATASNRTVTNDPYTFNHTPNNNSQGVIVFAINYTTATNQITSITYGTASLTLIAQASDAAGETTHVGAWFVGSGIPTGTQTITVDLASATGDDIYFVVITLRSSDGSDTTVNDFEGISGDTTNPQVTLSTNGHSCMAFCGIASGLAAVGDLTPLANMSTVLSNDSGQEVQRVDRQTTSSTSDFTIGYTAANDDVAFVALNIRAV